jgi:RHS repeat-associated protein
VVDDVGNLRARYDYDAWGQRTKLSGDLDADFGFTGHLHHKPTGLILTHYRAYDPRLGRWLSRDPIAENGGINLYGYVENNPIRFWDPFGLSTYEGLQALNEAMGNEGDLAENAKNWADQQTKDMGNAALEAANTAASVVPGSAPAQCLGARVAGKTLRKFWEKFYGKKWPKTADGKNYDAHHKKPVADGGAERDPRNIEPREHNDHMNHHKENGDFKRWGSGN